MSVHSFLTIASPSQGLYKEKGSKFLSFAFPVSSDASIKECLLQLRKEYYDANHHCYAWMLGADGTRFRTNDDGEPNHSAGDPILGQIRAKNVTDVLVVVVRYFGGTKLGVGGLVAAYKAAAEIALLNAVVIEKEVMRSASIYFTYADMNEAMRLVRDFDLLIVSRVFADDCVLEVQIKMLHYEVLMKKIKLLQDLGFSIKMKED